MASVVALPDNGASASSASLSAGKPANTKPKMASSVSKQHFAAVPMAKPNKVFDLAARCKADPHPTKLNLGVGAYRDDEGRPHVLSIVKDVEEEMAADVAAGRLNHEYPPMGGSQALVRAAAELALGTKSQRIQSGQVTGVQALSGTGALRLATEFLKRFHDIKHSMIPDPTWENHKTILKECDFDVSMYRYYDESTLGLDIDGLTADLLSAPESSVIMLHACAHNPTGVDPTQEQWKAIADACEERQHVVIFDCAYLGFASGSTEKDAFAMRLFAERGLNFFICMSFSKNFGLYSERCGVTLYVGSNPSESAAVVSQLMIIGRPLWSVPPMHGAVIVERVLTNPARRSLWKAELKMQAERILRMRRHLYEGLKKHDPDHDWSHVVSQTGMFTYTGLSKEQCDELVAEHHVYLLDTGRINVSGIPADGVAYLVKAICAVVNKPDDEDSVDSFDMEEGQAAAPADGAAAPAAHL